MCKSPAFLALILVCLVSWGCRTAKAPPMKTASGSNQVRVGTCILLYQLLEQQKNVSKLLIIKRERPDLKDLIKRIASASAAGAKTLETYAKQDSNLSLKQSLLPPGEAATRDAIASTRTKELLTTSGDEFELRLLMTQSEALTYAWHLAKVAAASETNPARARKLNALSEEMKILQAEVIALLRSRRMSAKS